LYVVS